MKTYLYIALFLFVTFIPPIAAQEPLWRFVTGGRITTPAVSAHDGTVYVAAEDRYLYAIDTSGQMKWRLALGGKPGASLAMLPDNNLVISLTDGTLLSVNPGGGVVWRNRLDSLLKFSPSISPGGGIFGITALGTVYSISHRGLVLWRFSLGREPLIPQIAGPSGLMTAVREGSDTRITLLGNNGKPQFSVRLPYAVAAFQPAAEGVLATSPGHNPVLISPDGGIAWKAIPVGGLGYYFNDESGSVFGGPYGSGASGKSYGWYSSRYTGAASVVESRYLYLLSSSGLLRAVSRQGGAEAWTYQMKGSGTFLSLGDRGRLYASGDDWTLYCFLSALPGSGWISRNGGTGYALWDSRPWSYPASAGVAYDPAEYITRMSIDGGADSQKVFLEQVRHLIETGGAEAVTPLIRKTLASLADAFLSTGGNAEVMKAIPGPAVRGEAAMLLGQVGELTERSRLISIFMNDPDGYVRESAARGLGFLGSDPDGLALEAFHIALGQRGIRKIDERIATGIFAGIKGIAAYHGYLPYSGSTPLLVSLMQGDFSRAFRMQVYSYIEVLRSKSHQ